MNKRLSLSLIIASWSLCALAYPNYQPPANNMASKPGAPADSANNTKQPPVPAWMKTSPWFTPPTLSMTGTAEFDNNDAAWDSIDTQQGYSPVAASTTADPFGFPTQDTPAPAA